MLTFVTKNSSHEIPSCTTPDITFPKPVFIFAPNKDIPDLFNGVLLKLIEKAIGRSINGATLQMYYYDEQLGNRSTVIKNLDGGLYHCLMPTKNTTIKDYFHKNNLLSTISQQSDALME